MGEKCYIVENKLPTIGLQGFDKRKIPIKSYKLLSFLAYFYPPPILIL